MSRQETNWTEDLGYCSNAPQVPLVKSPARLLAHLHDKADEPMKNQLLEAAKWIMNSPEAIGFCRLTALCYDVPTKLQDGPQCGLVALWMASIGLTKSKYLSNQDTESDSAESSESMRYAEPNETFFDKFNEQFPAVEWIQNKAKENMFSVRGEMFSSENLAALAGICFHHFLSECAEEHDIFTSYVLKNVYSMLTSYKRMVEFFSDENYHQVMLVPYDSDYDQRPCTRRGHKSHWCVISGIATFISNSKLSLTYKIDQFNLPSIENHNESSAKANSEINYKKQAAVDDSSKMVVIFKNKILPNASQKVNDLLKNEIFDQKQTKCKNGISDLEEKEEDPCFYLVAKQSKSKRLFLFDPRELAASNRNLKEISPERFGVQNSMSHHELFNKYVIPSGGLRAGLANQVVILKIKV